MKEPSKQTLRALQKEDGQIEVSYTTLTIDSSNDNKIIQKIGLNICFCHLLRYQRSNFLSNFLNSKILSSMRTRAQSM
jgi:hypothetical protein